MAPPQLPPVRPCSLSSMALCHGSGRTMQRKGSTLLRCLKPPARAWCSIRTSTTFGASQSVHPICLADLLHLSSCRSACAAGPCRPPLLAAAFAWMPPAAALAAVKSGSSLSFYLSTLLVQLLGATHPS
eukprot:3569527-Amphidinium_carterae.3